MHSYKSIFFFVLFLATSGRSQLSAQLVTKDFSSPAIQALTKSKIYVVQTNDSAFNTWLKGALERVWSVGELTYINEKQLDTLVKSDKNIFLFAQSRDDRGATVHLLN